MNIGNLVLIREGSFWWNNNGFDAPRGVIGVVIGKKPAPLDNELNSYDILWKNGGKGTFLEFDLIKVNHGHMTAVNGADYRITIKSEPNTVVLKYGNLKVKKEKSKYILDNLESLKIIQKRGEFIKGIIKIRGKEQKVLIKRKVKQKEDETIKSNVTGYDNPDGRLVREPVRLKQPPRRKKKRKARRRGLL